MISHVWIVLMTTAGLALSMSEPVAAQARTDHVASDTSQMAPRVDAGREPRSPSSPDATATRAKRSEVQGGRAEESAATHTKSVAAVELAERLTPRPSSDEPVFEALCRGEGPGYWWDGKTCLTNEEILSFPRGQTPGLHGGW